MKRGQTWLAAILEASGRWVLPLAVGRRDLAAGTATTLTIRHPRAGQAAYAGDAPRPVLLLDSHYDVVELMQAELEVDLLARLAAHRRFYRRPGPYRGRGPRPKHGPLFRLAEPTTHGILGEGVTLVAPEKNTHVCSHLQIRRRLPALHPRS